MTYSAHSLASFGRFQNSRAITKSWPSPTPQDGSVPITEVKPFLETLRPYAERLPRKQHPHTGAELAVMHYLADVVAKKTAKKMEAAGKSAVCASGCEACCYYADIEMTGNEFEEVLRFVEQHPEPNVRRQLHAQISQNPKPEIQNCRPCPFLNLSTKSCGIYPVRPLGCRALLSSRTCQLDKIENLELNECVTLTLEAWNEMPVRSGMILAALDAERSGEKHFRLDRHEPLLRVNLKELEADLLAELFSETSTSSSPDNTND